MVSKAIRDLIIEQVQRVPLPPEVKTPEEAFKLGIRMALEARIQVNGKDLEQPGQAGPSAAEERKD